MPTIHNANVVSLPIVGLQDKYLDWRLITDPVNNPGLVAAEYQPGELIVRPAFNEVCDYLEGAWKTHLLPPNVTPLPAVPPASLNAPASGAVTVSGINN